MQPSIKKDYNRKDMKEITIKLTTDRGSFERVSEDSSVS
jgi:hypothetical protein